MKICHWRDSDEDGKYKQNYSSGYHVTNYVELTIVFVSLIATFFSLIFIRVALTTAPQVHLIVHFMSNLVSVAHLQVVRDRQSRRIERYMGAFIIIWSLRTLSNLATCGSGLYPGPSNITFWIWIAPGGWGIVNLLVLGTSRVDEAKEYCMNCCRRTDDDSESVVRSLAYAISSHSYS